MRAGHELIAAQRVANENGVGMRPVQCTICLVRERELRECPAAVELQWFVDTHGMAAVALRRLERTRELRLDRFVHGPRA